MHTSKRTSLIAVAHRYQAEYQSMEAFKDGPLLTREALVQSCGTSRSRRCFHVRVYVVFIIFVV